ncbi:hypothetical protein D9C73_002597 [Collichthys lucidus]|uniref:Uncharacterized protein n=1 Tax=Collichthys lucidus TaxID=240159 RepID=A0A4U5U323_COLLU|nr:hypothetical protein D9C73_002597 [Collichthys lucidus]
MRSCEVSCENHVNKITAFPYKLSDKTFSVTCLSLTVRRHRMRNQDRICHSKILQSYCRSPFYERRSVTGCIVDIPPLISSVSAATRVESWQVGPLSAVPRHSLVPQPPATLTPIQRRRQIDGEE